MDDPSYDPAGWVIQAPRLPEHPTLQDFRNLTRQLQQQIYPVSEQRQRALTHGYACLRNQQQPHPQAVRWMDPLGPAEMHFQGFLSIQDNLRNLQRLAEELQMAAQRYRNHHQPPV